jgi:hypothetical protein
MKTALIALLAIACSATLFAGDTRNGASILQPLPDAGASVLLLGIGLTAVGFARRAFRP